MQENTINIQSMDDLFKTTSKYNLDVILTEEDRNSNTKILCKEDYAQELYDKMNNYSEEHGISTSACKDLEVGEVYDVVATQISFDDGVIRAHEVNSKAEIIIPFKEYESSIDDLARGMNLNFKVMITRIDGNNDFIGSEKSCISIVYKDELFKHIEDKTWFSVKIKKLIKGGYVALYKNNLECFIPGSHAGANVIRDFSKLLDTELNVMVDNYDASNNLFILSYKKYIKHSMPDKVTELSFGKKYTGVLTNKPYDFGMFVELEGYFTGLIHSSEFENYAEAKKIYKGGSEIDCYIKNVTRKGDNYRVVLTLDPDEIDSVKRQWDELREKTENKTFEYEIDAERNSIKINIDGESVDVSLRRQDLAVNLSKYPRVRVYKVDPINKNLKFEFIGE